MNKLDRPAVKLSDAEQTLVGLLRDRGADETARRLETVGLPTRRVEAYHFTDLKVMLREVPDRLADRVAGKSGAPTLKGATGIRLVNGILGGHDKLPAGLEVSSGKGAGALSDDIVDLIGAGFARGTVRLLLTKSQQRPIHLDLRTEGEASVSTARVEIEIGDAVEATLLQTWSSTNEAHLVNAGVTVRLGKNATLTHVQIDLQDGAVRQLVHVDFQISAGAKLRTLTINNAAILSRLGLSARFNGAGAHADFTGLNLSGGSQHHDITLNVSHAVPGTTSKELFKSIARDRAKAVFQGKIVVERDAQKTDAKMMAQGLMLSEGAEIIHKPELEIFADDVVCGHGATCGDLDEAALFYLMSRGIPRPTAESMLIRAFVAELFEPIEDEALRALLDGLVDTWLGAGTGVRAAA
ncbi:MAG: Fe-S cluster assembly protein SufD [Cucumibacter sp.]